MSKLAIVGMGPTWDLYQESDADEFWGINYMWELEGFEPDRVYDMHNLYWYRDSENIEKLVYHWEEWVTQPKDAEFWTVLDYPEVPDCKVYPVRDVIDTLLSDFKRDSDEGYKEIAFFNSSFDYLMAHAIYEHVKGIADHSVIELYGWSMGWMGHQSETEYRYQLPGLTFWTGMALGNGIEVVIDKDVGIFKSRMYTYGGSQMITRQHLEGLKQKMKLTLEKRQADFHNAQGKMEQMRDLVKVNPRNEAYQKSLKSAQMEVNEAFRQMMFAEGGLEMVNHQLNHIDTGEEDQEIQSKFTAIINGEISG